MAAVSGYQKMFRNSSHSNYVAANGHTYLVNGFGEIEHVLASDVTALQSQGFSLTNPRDAIRNSPGLNYGKG